MATQTEFTQTVQDELTSAIKQGQDMNLAAIEVVRDFAALFGQPVNTSRGLPKGLPSPTKVADQAYGLASRLLELQHEYTVRLVKAVSPIGAERS